MDRKQNRLRVNIKHELEISAPAARIFPLACPVREREWIDQWKYELIYSDSGYNENNGIFTETMSFPFLFERLGEICWHTTLYDPESCRVQFLLVCEKIALIKWEIGIIPQGADASTVLWNLTLTSLDREVDVIGSNALSERLTGIVVFLGQALKHYCETGNILKLN